MAGLTPTQAKVFAGVAIAAAVALPAALIAAMADPRFIVPIP